MASRTTVELDWTAGRSPLAFIGRLEAFEEALQQRLESAMQKAVQLVEYEAKARAPVDTGNLRSSIAGEVRPAVKDAVEGVVGSNVEYAPFQEYGTSKMGAQPFLRPAIESMRPRIVELFELAVDEAATAVGLD